MPVNLRLALSREEASLIAHLGIDPRAPYLGGNFVNRTTLLVHRTIVTSAILFSVGTATACGDKEAAKAPESTGQPVASAAASGAELYSMRCVSCHQPNGEGTPGVYPPLAGSEVANGPAEVPIKIVLKGLTGPVVVRGNKFEGTMPAFGVGIEMSDEEIAALLTYVRSQWGNTGGPVTAEEVARVRESVKDRTTPWTAAELGIQH